MKQELSSALRAIDSDMQKEGLHQKIERIAADPRPAYMRKNNSRMWSREDWAQESMRLNELDRLKG